MSKRASYLVIICACAVLSAPEAFAESICVPTQPSATAAIRWAQATEPGSLTFSSRSRRREAYRLWRRLEKEQYDQEAILSLAGIYVEERYPREAVALLIPAVERQPDAIEVRLLLADLLDKLAPKADSDRVLTILAGTVARAPGDARAYVSLGYALRRRGRFTQALACFEEALVVTDSSWLQLSAHLGAASVAIDLKNAAKEAEHMAAARRIEPLIDEVLLRSQAASDLPRPIFGGSIEADGVHPPAEERIRRVLERIRELEKGDKEEKEDNDDDG